MLKRYYTDLVTDAEVSAQQAYRFFTQVDDWQNWSNSIDKVKLFGGEWRKGATFIFWAKLGDLPAAPVPVKVLEVIDGQSITWGLDLPGAKIKHRFNFIPVDQGSCRIHHEEWSEGLVTILAFPVGGLITKFNEQFAGELAAMF